jgi:dihydrofolate synthase/folylpolyglutamate synthase
MTAPLGSDLVLERLTKLHPKLIDLVLDRVQRLLDRVGNPERRLPPVVHVAGTNGKGSTVAYLRAILEAAGYRVHAYTSPHLVRFHERIRLAGRLIEEPELLALLEECERANGDQQITFFEVTTVAAFLAFTRHKADILLLEVGLGGTHDATNVIEHPLACCLTPISMDHMQHLGHTLAEIAANKAGIMKRGRPVAIGPQPAEAEAVFEARGAELGAPLHRVGQEWNARREGEALLFRDKRGETSWPLPALPGLHQIENAGLALATLPLLDGFSISESAIAKGLRSVEWPARLQRLRRGPVVEALPPGWEAWLDGGHNESGGQALGLHAAGWRRERPDLPIRLVFGMLSTHDPVGFLKPLLPHIQDVTAVAVGGNHQALDVEALVDAARRAGAAQVRGAPSADAAARAIVAADPTPARLLICGSLYLAGEVLAKNG